MTVAYGTVDMATPAAAHEAGVSAYLLYLVASATLGALQFGYHLVCPTFFALLRCPARC